MHRMLTSVVLCVVAQTTAAQCVDSATQAAAQVRSGGELIKTAVAGSRDAPAVRQASATTGRSKVQADGDEEGGSTGPAMLLAAVALMSGIAWRRSGGSGQ